MIAMRVKDHLGEAARNRTSLIVCAGSVDRIVVRPAGYSKGQLALNLSNSSPFGSTSTVLPSWSATRSSLLWHYKVSSLRRSRTNRPSD